VERDQKIINRMGGSRAPYPQQQTVIRSRGTLYPINNKQRIIRKIEGRGKRERKDTVRVWGLGGKRGRATHARCPTVRMRGNVREQASKPNHINNGPWREGGIPKGGNT